MIAHFFSLGNDANNGGTSNPKCGGNYNVPQGEGSSFYCRPSLLGRYVTITIPGNSKILTLCEVEVYSERRGMLYDKDTPVVLVAYVCLKERKLSPRV